MPIDPRTPVIVGVGQVTNRRERIVDPMTLMEEAAGLADTDAKARVLARAGSVRVVNVLSWSWQQPASTLGSRLGLPDGERLYTTVGGNTPQWLLARTCDDIVAGRQDVVLLAGAEALDSARRARAEGIEIDRGDRRAPVTDETVGDARDVFGPADMAAGLVEPASIYPMFESALAAEAGRTPEEHRRWLGELMAPFTRVAASHPDHAWFPEGRTPEELSTVTPDNRLVGEPYTKTMNAVLQVDQGTAILLASAEAAEAAGVPRDRWVFPVASAEVDDPLCASARPSFTRSPALEAAGRAVFETAGVGPDDLAWVDVYSCFPSAVQIGARALGLPLDGPPTVTGGLPYFGGPGSNYVSHSIAVTAERCRAEPEAIGLCTGVGWFMSKNAVGLYSASPPAGGWQHPDTSEAQRRIDADAVEVLTEAEGAATVEAMTVRHSRDEGPRSAPIFARIDGGRVVAVTADPDLPHELAGRNLVGEEVRVRTVDGNVVYEPR